MRISSSDRHTRKWSPMPDWPLRRCCFTRSLPVGLVPRSPPPPVAAGLGGGGGGGGDRSAKPTGKERVKQQRLNGQSGIGDHFRVWRSEEEMRMRQTYD